MPKCICASLCPHLVVQYVTVDRMDSMQRGQGDPASSTNEVRPCRPRVSVSYRDNDYVWYVNEFFRVHVLRCLLEKRETVPTCLSVQNIRSSS